MSQIAIKSLPFLDCHKGYLDDYQKTGALPWQRGMGTKDSSRFRSLPLLGRPSIFGLAKMRAFLNCQA